VVKKNRVTVQLKKVRIQPFFPSGSFDGLNGRWLYALLMVAQVKGEFSYDQWMDLTAKRPKSDTKSSDPTGGIMDLMKNLYEEGDGDMKKVIGEAMVRRRRY
jgi:hypothetical protein